METLDEEEDPIEHYGVGLWRAAHIKLFVPHMPASYAVLFGLLNFVFPGSGEKQGSVSDDKERRF